MPSSVKKTSIIVSPERRSWLKVRTSRADSRSRPTVWHSSPREWKTSLLYPGGVVADTEQLIIGSGSAKISLNHGYYSYPEFLPRTKLTIGLKNDFFSCHILISFVVTVDRMPAFLAAAEA